MAANPAHAQLRQLLEEQWRHHVAVVVQLSIDMCDGQRIAGDDLSGTARLIAAERLTLQEIEAALDRLTAGSYGRCEQCGQQISAQRLEILPHTRFCAACQPRDRMSADAERPRDSVTR